MVKAARLMHLRAVFFNLIIFASGLKCGLYPYQQLWQIAEDFDRIKRQ